VNKIKKLLVVFLIVLTTLILIPTVSADVFPKSTLTIEVNYHSNRDVYFELLYHGDPYELTEEELENRREMEEDLFNFLHNKSLDGYVSATHYRAAPFYISKENTNFGYSVTITYLYPRTFKLLMFDKTNNSIFISEEITQNAFDSKMKVTYTEDFVNNSYSEITIVEESVNISEQHFIFKGIVGIVLRIVLTLIIELFILYLFLYREKSSFIKALIVNLITHTALTITLFVAFYTSGAWTNVFLIIPLEILVIIVEVISYRYLLKEQSTTKSSIYAVVANVATIAIGLIPFFLW